VKRLAVGRYRPENLARHIRFSLWQFLMLQRKLPQRFAQIIEKIDRGDLSVKTEHRNLESLLNTLENTFNRLTLGIVTGAIIMGSSMIITTGIGPFWFGFPALGILGYCASALFGIWIVINIFRSKRY
jgi:ubiquinone biosynthesis protein